MILFPNAKLNLGLHILSRRNDNYHNLETLMYPVGLCDILEFLPLHEKETIFKITGIPVVGEITGNLVYKAYLLLKNRYHLPGLHIHLHKIIPAGAGLGGGSSDGAFMLKGLNNMFDLKLNDSELKNYAAILGSDCSFFIENIPAIATGKGEELSPFNLSLKDYRILIFSPGFPVSTAEAYQGVIPDPGRASLSSISGTGISYWRDTLKNDFEKSVFLKYPPLRDLKQKLYEYGAIYASMSGSGSTLYGLFEKNFKTPEVLKEKLIWEGRTLPNPPYRAVSGV